MLGGYYLRLRRRIMKWSIRTVFAASLGLSFSAAACSWCKKLDDQKLLDDGGSFQPQTDQGPTGTVGSNGLKPCVYAKYMHDLTVLMQRPLLKQDGILSNDWDVFIDSDKVFAWRVADAAMQCVLPADATAGKVKDHNGRPYQGRGLLNPNILARWKMNTSSSSSVNPNDEQSVHTCMATLMNTSEGIQVWMEGANVYDGIPLDAGTWSVVEGYWATTLASDGGTTTYYWPPSKSPDHESITLLAEDRVKNAGNDADARAFKIWGGRFCSSPVFAGTGSGVPNVACPLLPGTGICRNLSRSSSSSSGGSSSSSSSSSSGGPNWECEIVPNGTRVSAVETRLQCCDCCLVPGADEVCYESSNPKHTCECKRDCSSSSSSSSSGGTGGCPTGPPH
jgi:hypothetical protein